MAGCKHCGGGPLRGRQTVCDKCSLIRCGAIKPGKDKGQLDTTQAWRFKRELLEAVTRPQCLNCKHFKRDDRSETGGQCLADAWRECKPWTLEPRQWEAQDGNLAVS